MSTNKILKGDCLELMSGIAPGSIDMILCDLPYGTTACKWDVEIPFKPLWSHYKRIIKPNGAIVLTATQPFTSKLIMSNIEAFKYEWIWHKSRCTGFLQADFMPMKAHENICVFCYSGKPTFNPQKSKGHIPTNSAIGDGCSPSFKANKKRNYIGGDTTRNPKTVQYFKSERGLHSAQKPVALFEYLIKTYTNIGDTVLDNCAGSGTTAVACDRTDRKYIVMEQEQESIDVIYKRIEEETRQGRLFKEGGAC